MEENYIIDNSQRPRDAYLYEALFSFGMLVLVMGVGIVVYGVDPHMPMLVGVLFAALMALKIGYKWKETRSAMYDGIGQALQAVIILMLIGVLIGVWVLSGVVPSMIYYGLNLLSPSIFLVATVLICSVTSLATGTSWGTAGTIGIALIGISYGLGIPAPMTAGAIISGAYFGDKMSPLSDTTNLAPAVAGTDLFTHIKFMMLPTTIAYLLTLGFFGYLSMQFDTSDLNLGIIDTIKDTLTTTFTISPVLLLPPLVVIVSIAFKLPAIPGIALGILVGCGLAPIYQDANLGDLLQVGMHGFEIETGVESMDKLLNTGGLMNMMSSVSLTVLAMMFGGIMERTGQLEVIVNYLLKYVRSVQGLIISTMGTCVLSNCTMPEQYISIVVPGRMFAPAYKKRNLDPKTLSNTIESSGTVLSVLVPWNTCAIFMTTVLGVTTLEYAQWAFFNYITPLVLIVLSYLGTAIVYNKKNPAVQAVPVS